MSNSAQYELFQNALAAARLEKGLTQSDIAARLGKPQSFVSKYESGERRLDVIEFLEVCEALSANPQAILRKVRPHDE
jgi:transcriptional regulator with XRE-family HTH domain